MKVYNATQHQPTASQIEAGVENPKEWDNIVKLLNFEQLPSKGELLLRALQIGILLIRNAKKGDKVMIGGAPYFMPFLERELVEIGLIPVYSFSPRVSQEVVDEQGQVKKVSVFVHQGFVEVV